ncbi:hypothetical protein Bca101_062347 [Brassica carinata]
MVLVRLEELAQTTSGGVLLPKAAVKFERDLTGEIVSVGSEVGQQVGPGKKVLFFILYNTRQRACFFATEARFPHLDSFSFFHWRFSWGLFTVCSSPSMTTFAMVLLAMTLCLIKA